MAFSAGEPLRSLTHSECRVVGFDFSVCVVGGGGGGGGNAMNDEASSSLTDPGGGDGEVMECIFKDGEVGFVAYAQVPGRSGKRDVVRGCDVRQDKRRVGDIGVVDDCLVDGLEGMVCGFLSVVQCRS